MNFKDKRLFLSILTLTLFLLAIVLNIPAALAPTTEKSCAETPLQFTSSKPVYCAKRLWVAGPYYSTQVSSKGDPVHTPVYFKLNEGAPKFSIFGQSLRTDNHIQIVNESEPRIVATSYSVGTSWSAAARIQFIFHLQSDTSYRIDQGGNLGPYEFIMTPPQKEVLSPPQAGMNPPTTSQRIRFMTFASCLLIALTGIYSYRSKTTLSYCVFVTSLFFVITLFCGLPFGSTTGWYDPGDDKSYVHWTYNLGYLFDPFLYHSDLRSWSQGSNHHVWGTGLLLAPFVAPGLLLGRPIIDTVFLGLMSHGVIILCFFSVLIYFTAFRRIANDFASAIAAIGTLACTNLLKWTYMRNFFSHSPEAFALSIATYGFIGRYFAKQSRKYDFALMLLGFFLSVQVRRENLGFLIPLICFEAFGLRHRSITADLAHLRKNFFGLAAILATAASAELVLRFTNYFTDLKSFSGTVAATSYLHLDKIGEMLSRNGFEVFFGESFGLFYWKNLFVWASIFALVKFWRSYRIWAPLALTVFAFCSLCVLYEMPNGVEWQNRFLLKLNPIFFAVLAVLMSQQGLISRFVGLVGVSLAAYFELQLYNQMLPSGMTFYVYQFGDVSLKYPQTFPGFGMYIFYLPLVSLLVFMLAALGGHQWKRH